VSPHSAAAASSGLMSNCPIRFWNQLLFGTSSSALTFSASPFSGKVNHLLAE
jgi:hypothetical protein